jgi:hypothetical protein
MVSGFSLPKVQKNQERNNLELNLSLVADSLTAKNAWPQTDQSTQ